MQIKNKYPWLKHLDFQIVDLVSMILSFTLAFFIKFGGFWFLSGEGWISSMWIRLIMVICGADIIITMLLNPYSGIFRRLYYMEVIRVIQLTSLNMISVALVLYVFKQGSSYSRAVFIMTYALYFAVSLLLKYIWKKLIFTGIVKTYSSKQEPLFILCNSDNAETVLVNVSAGDLGLFEIKGMCLADAPEGVENFGGVPVVGGDYVGFVLKNNIENVLIALPPSQVSFEDYKRLIDNAVNVHISVESMVGVQTEDQFIDDIGIYKTLSIGAFTFRPGQLVYLVIKRLLDFLFGLIGAVILIPVSAVIKAASLISGDRAGIFYTQERIGQNGRHIKILKYRTMVPDAEQRLEELLKDPKYRDEWEKNQKLSDDPRITRVGRFLRRTSVDELPQVINLLKADMSLVGPRPLVEGELEAHNGLRLYQKVKPGITGWWACNGRSNIEYRERLELEYYYIKHFSVYLDAMCVLRTVLAVLKKDGAQ